MPLRDHFHPPLYPGRGWPGFFASWAARLADWLNRCLPAHYFAEIRFQSGVRLLDDAPVLEAMSQGYSYHQGGTATLVAAKPYAPPAAAFAVPVAFPDSMEVQVFATEGGVTLVAAVELVSPGNKDRPEARRAFAAKCWTYLQQGIGLVVVDIVTSRSGNLHNELMDLMEREERFRLAAEGLYAAAYRPCRVRKQERNEDRIEVWPSDVRVGQPLPLLPLPLDKGQFVPLELEAAYEEAYVNSRLP
jgi:hypothetical protein